MEHRIDFEHLDDTPPHILDGLRGAIILKLSQTGIAWEGGASTPPFDIWSIGRDEDAIDDVADDIDTLIAVERALGMNQPKH